MKSKKLWILLVLLAVFCGIGAILFLPNLVTDEKGTRDAETKAEIADKGAHPTDGESNRLREQIESMEATISKLEDKLDSGKLQTETKSVEIDENQIEEKLKGQQKQLENIIEKAARKRQEIQQYYNRRHAEIQSNAAEASRSAKAEDRAAWAKFQEKLKNTTSFREGSSIATGYIAPSGNFSAYGNYLERTDTYVRGNPSQEYAVKRRQTDEAKYSTLTSCKLDLEQLQRRTQYELDQVDKWEKRMKSHVSTAINSIIAKSKSETPGLIKGIVSSEDGFGAMIGIEFVREGDSIDSIKIVKIHKDRVEFEKNGKRWTQGLNETPDPEWQK